MARTAGTTIISGTDLYATEVNASSNVGEKFQSQDGRFFRYARADASTATVIGNLLQAPAQLTDFKDMSVQAAAAVNATTIAVTLGNTATTAGLFRNGFLAVSVTPGLGQFFRVLDHDNVSATTTCNFDVEEKVQVALTTSSKVSVVSNPHRGVIQMPTTHTGMAVGGAVTVIPAANHGYVQTGGPGAALSDATVTSATGMALSASVTTAGCVTKAVNQDLQVAVSQYTVTVSGEVQPVWWTFDT